MRNNAAEIDPGSFRDPGGRVFLSEGRVFRTVTGANTRAFEAARDAGVYDRLARKGLLLDLNELDAGDLPQGSADVAAGADHILEHPRIPFLSYPYEWSFAAHRAAALLHLDLHLEALDAGFTLSDATAYNVQFIGTKPVFIDHLSLHPYEDGELWTGHRQFCMQFLNPLLFWHLLETPPNPWFRGSLEGISPEDMAPLLSLRNRMSWTVFTHVVMQAALQKKAIGGGRKTDDSVKATRLPRQSFLGMLMGLRSYIAKMQPPKAPTVWGDYAQHNSYGRSEAERKRDFVKDMVSKVKPGLMFDIGCNTGDYSDAALDAGAGYVVGFDYDHGALDIAFDRFAKSERPFLPLWLDAANPSPAQGWAQRERKGLGERGNADALVALAFIHHIVIGRNVPLPMAIDWLTGLAPTGIIEFPPKSDPMVQRLLALREDIFPDYTEEAFLAVLGERAKIVASEHVSENGRLLVWYDRRAG